MHLYTLSTLFFILTLNSFGISQNLIKNGQFDKNLTNWDITYAEGSPVLKMQVIARNKVFEDAGLVSEEKDFNFVELTSTSVLQQNIPTKLSEGYTLVFAYSHRPNVGNKKLIVAVNGIAIHTLDIPNNLELGQFKYQQIHFNAPSNDTQISFYVVSSASTKDKGILITDILCQKTSEINLEESAFSKVTFKN